MKKSYYVKGVISGNPIEDLTQAMSYTDAIRNVMNMRDWTRGHFFVTRKRTNVYKLTVFEVNVISGNNIEPIRSRDYYVEYR